MQTGGSCSIHLESENFHLCNPQKKPIQHVNINFTSKQLQSQGALLRIHSPAQRDLTSQCPWHSSEEQSPRRVRRHSRSRQSPAHWRGCNQTSPSPWMDHSRHCRHSLHVHRSPLRWNSRAAAHHQSPDSAAPLCAPSIATPRGSASRGGKHSRFHDLIQAEEDLPFSALGLGDTLGHSKALAHCPLTTVKLHSPSIAI